MHTLRIGWLTISLYPVRHHKKCIHWELVDWPYPCTPYVNIARRKRSAHWRRWAKVFLQCHKIQEESRLYILNERASTLWILFTMKKWHLGLESDHKLPLLLQCNHCHFHIVINVNSPKTDMTLCSGFLTNDNRKKLMLIWYPNIQSFLNYGHVLFSVIYKWRSWLQFIPTTFIRAPAWLCVAPVELLCGLMLILSQ